MFIFNSPSNPSGQIYSWDELAALAKVFEKYPNILIVSDEIYEHINYQGRHASIGQFESLREQVVIINGMSKAFAMTGWRIGYMAGPEWLVKACQKLQGQYTSGACSVSQKAAVAALLGDQSVVKCMVNVFKERRDLVVSYLRQIPGYEGEIPQGAFYVLPDVSAYFGKKAEDIEINNADDLSMYLLNHAHVATVSGKPFGAPNCIRLSYASNTKVLSEAMFRIKKAMQKVS
jgi:aspartate aminotransferase